MNFRLNKKKGLIFLIIIILEIIFLFFLSMVSSCVSGLGVLSGNPYFGLSFFIPCGGFMQINEIVVVYLYLLVLPVLSYIGFSLGEKK